MKKLWVFLLFLAILNACSSNKKEAENTAVTTTSTIKAMPKDTSNPPNPPYNDFDQSSQVGKDAGERALMGAVSGTVIGSIISSPAPVVGGVIGGTVGGAIAAIDTATKESPQNLMKQLETEQIQVIQQGKTITLIVPTDAYYMPNSDELDETSYKGLVHIAQLVIRDSDDGIIYVTGFSDAGIGSPREHQKMSEKQARSMADFLWANGIPLNRLVYKGYGENYDIGDHFLIHGAAMNRRVEIQWQTKCCPPLSGNLCRN